MMFQSCSDRCPGSVVFGSIPAFNPMLFYPGEYLGPESGMLGEAVPIEDEGHHTAVSNWARDQARKKLQGPDFEKDDPKEKRKQDALDMLRRMREKPDPAFWPQVAAVAVPTQTMVPTHNLVPGHRIGLPHRDTVIPGTVTHLDGDHVGVLWDDGQQSLEVPNEVYLL